MGEIIVSIILFIVSFGILISIHEAGHLAMAKLFKVYCKEYSIGFGPALYSRKKENQETKFSVRAIPFGGYVSMYGEGMENDPDFKDIPHERSLEGIKKWKKAIILSAGVVLNAFLAFVFIFISNFAFPNKYTTINASVQTNSVIANAGVADNDRIQFIFPDSYKNESSISPFYYEFTDKNKLIHANNFYIVDPEVVIDSEKYVLTFMFSGNKKNPVFTDGLLLYKAIDKTELNSLEYETDLKKDFIEWSKLENSPSYYPNFEIGPKTFELNATFTPKLTFQKADSTIYSVTPEISIVVSKKGAKTINTFKDIGLSFKLGKEWLPIRDRFRYTFEDYGNSCVIVFKGIGTLFSGGIRNMSGIVGIFDASKTFYANYTFAYYLQFWGIISVNLAIFNLLPFPGLDGWQLLVTAIEGVTRKKIPMKAKNIVSLVGLGLLFTLMIVIVVLDVLRMIGI